MSWKRWLWVLLPLALAVIAALLLQLLLVPLPLLVVRMDVGTALAFLGGLITLLLVVRLLAQRASRVDCSRTLTEERQQQDAAHRRFLMRLDHELKNPLTAMRAALVNLSDSAGDRPNAAAMHDVQHQAERLSRLVSNLRKLAELEVRPIEQLPVDMGELLEEVKETVCDQPTHAGRSVELVMNRVPWPLPPVTGDRDLLGLAFYNLLENALKFTGPQDAVQVRAAEDGHTLTVEIADTGPGIAPDDLPRVFEELYRGNNARGVEGSGLGLALVQRVIARHGGEIGVRSRQDKTRGTVFTVRLPLAPSPERVTKR